jgi:hypothetical protein
MADLNVSDLEPHVFNMRQVAAAAQPPKKPPKTSKNWGPWKELGAEDYEHGPWAAVSFHIATMG